MTGSMSDGVCPSGYVYSGRSRRHANVKGRLRINLADLETTDYGSWESSAWRDEVRQDR